MNTPEKVGCLGYLRDIHLGEMEAAKPSLKFRSNGKKKFDVPRVSLGAHIDGALYPFPDPYSSRNVQGGVCKRFGCVTPKINHLLLGEFKRFVARWLLNNLTPLDRSTDLTVDTWLEGTNYPKWRKDQLKLCWDRCHGRLERRHFRNKSFIKRETYEQFKEARLINSRSDQFKVYSGPIFHAIEKQVYQLHWFIKHIPVPDRPEYIMKNVASLGGRYMCTDYSTFEACFVPEVMKAAEFQLYSYMVKNIKDARIKMRVIQRVMIGIQKCRFFGATVKVEATRMSGDMCTSLGNGFTNLMMMLFLCKKNRAEVYGVVEGDDGLFRVEGTMPSVEQFASLGMKIKIKKVRDVSEADFCGMIFHEKDRQLIRDAVYSVANVGWTFSELRRAGSKTLLQLLRAKALSLAYELPGCPISSSCAKWLLRCTEGIEARYDQVDHHYNTPRNPVVMIQQPTLNTRMLYERVFGVTVGEQEMIERWFDEQSKICPIPLYLFKRHLPQCSVDMWRRYVRRIPAGCTLAHFAGRTICS